MARPRVHDATLRNRLLDVATEVLATAGPRALTLRDAARRAGTSTSAVYSLFDGRDGLVSAAGDRAAETFAAHLRAVPRTTDPRADLLALGLAYRRFALEQPHAYRVMFTPPSDERTTLPDAASVREAPAFRVLLDAVHTVLGDTPDEQHAVRAATSVWALAHGLVSLELADQLPVPPAQRDDVYRRALTAAGPALLAAAGENEESRFRPPSSRSA